MFCPKCRAEYKAGVVKCADCHVPLVEKPTEPGRPEDVNLVKLLATFNPGDVAIVKSILDDAGIPYFLEGENFMHVYPLVEPARFMVPEKRVADALNALKDLKLSFEGISIPKGEDTGEGEDSDEDKPTE
jgi:hypothetical protein